RTGNCATAPESRAAARRHVGAITYSPVWSSRIRSSGHQTRDARAEAAEKIIDVAAEQRRSAGDRKRDKDYQHRVLGGRRAPLISPQAIDQTRHVQSFLVEYSGRPARGPTANGSSFNLIATLT